MKNIFWALIACLCFQLNFGQEADYYVLEGKVGKYPVTMNLYRDAWINDSDQIYYTGYYYYHSQEIPIGLYESNRIGKKLELTSWNDVNNQSEIFNGTFEKGKFKGTWTHGKSVLEFDLIPAPSSSFTELEYYENNRIVPIKTKNPKDTIEGEFGFSFFLPKNEKLRNELMNLIYDTRDDINTFTHAKLNEIEKEYKEEIQSYLNDGMEPAGHWNHSSFESLSPLINNQNYLVMIFSGYQYTGGAHGFSYEQFYTYEHRKQKWLELKDVLNLNFTKEINKVLDKAARKEFNLPQGKKLNEIEESPFIAEEISVTENFTLSKKGITFHYGLYELTPYAFGYYEILIPYEDLKPYLAKGFAY